MQNCDNLFAHKVKMMKESKGKEREVMGQVGILRYENRGSTYVTVGDDVESVEEKKRREKRKRSKAGRVRRRGINKLETLSEHELTQNALLRGGRRGMQEINGAYEGELKQIATETTSKIPTYYVGDIYGLDVN